MAQEKIKEKIKLLLPFPVLLIIGAAYFLVWAKLYLDLYLNTDFGWLFTCLERFLAGGTYTTDFYETNPPLSFLIYYPAYLLYKIAGISPEQAIFLLFSITSALIGMVIWKYLRIYGFSKTMMIAFLGSYLFVGTWIISSAFGQKDHLVFILLLPYFLMNVGQIGHKQIPRPLAITTSVLGALAICIKPYYIIIPAVFYLYKLHSERSPVKLLLSLDLWIFVLAGGLYALVMHLFFQDYLNIILPEVLELYTVDVPMPVLELLKFLFLSLGAFVVMLFVYETEETKYLKVSVYSLIGLSILCAIAYYTQNKGFFYQSIPFFACSSLAFILALFGLIYQSSRMADVAILIPCFILLIFTKAYMVGHPPGHLKASEFAQIPYHQKLKEYAKNGTYIDLEMKSSSLALPYYLNLKNGSRFGQIWPILGLKYKFEESLTEDEKNTLRKRLNHFIDMIAEDIGKNSPSVISVPRYTETGKPEPTQSYYNFFMKNENFAEAMKKYKFAETFVFDKNIYIRGSKNKKEDNQTVDFFIRIDEN